MLRRLPLMLLALGWCLSTAEAQDDGAVAGNRAPRFLLASNSSKPPIPIDIARTPVLSRRVSVELVDVPLDQALKQLSALGGFTLSYSTAAVPLDRRVRLKATDITVAAALTEVLLNADVDVVFSTSARAVLMPRPVTRKGVPREVGAVTGVVYDAKTRGVLAGVDVFLDGTRWRATTDTSGRYRLIDVDTGAYTLIARRLGYTKQSRRVIIRTTQEDTIDFALDPAAVALDELVTTATGQQRRRDLGNSITTIRADSAMRTAPIRSLTDLLDGRVPGMTVQHTSGAPGDPGRIRLRGLSSITRGNDPVVVVDGVRLYAAQSDARSGNLTNLAAPVVLSAGDPLSNGNIPAPSPLDQIDPNIIEKIEVFKGPSAATLYGADAANGVIVITTKKGRPGPTRWNASVTHARTSTPGRWPEGYYRWGHRPGQGSIDRLCPVLDLSCVADSLVRFQALNDPDLTLLGQGNRTALSLTASGGSQALTYSVTGSYSDEVGLLQMPAFEVERFRATFNRDAPDWMRRPHRLANWSVTSNVQALLGSTADVTLATSIGRTDQQRSSLEGQLSRVAGAYVDRVNGRYYMPGPLINNSGSAAANGDLAPFIIETPELQPVSTYLTEFYRRATASAVTMSTRLNANWRPRPWFTANGHAGVNVIPRDDQMYLPTGLVSPIDSGALIQANGRALVGDFSLQGTVRRPLGWGFAFEASVGSNLTTTATNDLVSSARGLRPGVSTIDGARLITATERRENSSSFGWYIEPRVTGQRLSFSTGIRLDGGSAYGARVSQSGGFGNLLSLPKFNGSWVISEEPFFPFKSLFSSLRLRGAYGQAQQQPGASDRLRLYTGRNLVSGELLTLTSVGNTELRPERSVELEGGFDADLFESRLSFELTLYRKTQVDALMPVTLPRSVNGGGVVIQNIGNIRNQGVELRARVTPLQLPSVTWGVEVLYSRNTNTLVKLGPGVVASKDSGLVEGYPVRGRWAKPILGYTDQNGNGILEPGEIQVGDSLVYTGRLYPDYTMEFSTNVALLNGAVNVTADFSYDAGATQIDGTALRNWVLTRALADPSTPFREQAEVLSLNRTTYGMTQDVSTFRFKAFSVNYRAPVSVARFVRAQQLTVALQGSNLGLHSSYRGKDPDVSAWTPGESIIDTGQLPMPRTWQLAMYLQY